MYSTIIESAENILDSKIENLYEKLGSMLTGSEIIHQRDIGNIEIEPFDHALVNPNSHNVRLHPEMKIYKSFKTLDMRKENETKDIIIPESGYKLKPGVIYIGRTVERIATDKFIPMINGRSSGGRLGLSIHICAGFGDIGFDGTFTLEITVVKPLIIYPNEPIAQICYFTPYGLVDRLYRGKYYKQIEATPSKFYKDFQKEE